MTREPTPAELAARIADLEQRIEQITGGPVPTVSRDLRAELLGIQDAGNAENGGPIPRSLRFPSLDEEEVVDGEPIAVPEPPVRLLPPTTAPTDGDPVGDPPARSVQPPPGAES